MWSMRSPVRTGLIWASVPLIGLMLAVGLAMLADWLLRPSYPDTTQFSSTTETLIALPGALAGALFFLSLFVAPSYLASAWHAWRQMKRLQEPGGANCIAEWTVDASAWRRFQAELRKGRDKDSDSALSKTALSLCDLAASSTGIDIRVGPESVLVGEHYVSLRGGLSEVTQADFESIPSLSGPGYLAFLSVIEGHSRSLGSYAIEEIGLIVPVPPTARAAMQQVVDHFTPEAIAALHARDRWRARAGCLLNLTMLAVSLAMIAASALFDAYQIGWYGLILFAVWLAWLAYYLVQALIAMIAGFGPMIAMLRRASRS